MRFFGQLRHSYFWNKYYYFLSIALTSIAAGFYYTGFDPFDIVCYPMILFALIFSFSSFQKDNFSIKYLQSLPISKKELYHLKLADNMLSLSPLFFWGVIFSPLVLNIFTDEKSTGVEGFVMLFLYYLFAAILISLWSFYRLYEMSRAAFVKGNPKIYNYQTMKLGIFYFTAAVYIIYSFIFAVDRLQHYAPQFRMDLFAFLSPLNSSWTVFGLVAVFTWFEYHRIFRRWQEEKRSYLRINWKPLRDVPLMALALSSILIPPVYVFSQSPTDYGKSALMDHVRSGKIAEVQKLLDQGVNINSKSTMGYTALMASAHLGNEKMYFYLLSKGASKEGVVHKSHKAFKGKDIVWLAVYGGNEAIARDLLNSKNVNQAQGASHLLHIASYSCHERIIDHLLELGADPKVKVSAGKNNLGKTPLHFATERNCLNGVISLIEAGAELNVRDSAGKLAAEYTKKYNKDLRYYLERKSRSPAGNERK